MTGTQTVRRTTTRARRGGSMQLLRGLGAAMLTTIIVVAVFALLMQWVKPTEDTVRTVYYTHLTLPTICSV